MLKFKPFRISRIQRFKDPDTGFDYRAPDRDIQALLRRIVNYRQQNDLEPIPYLREVVEHWQCSQPYNAGTCESNNNLHRSLLTYIKGGIALLKNYAYKSFVSQSVADERAAICITCPKNVNPDFKIYNSWADGVAVASVGDRKSIHHDKLFNCQVCTCPLRAKVWYNGKLDFSEKELKSFPHFCWQKKLYREQQKLPPEELEKLEE